MRYFVEMPSDGIKSQAPLHPPWQRQFIKMADHVHVTVEQRAKLLPCLPKQRASSPCKRHFRLSLNSLGISKKKKHYTWVVQNFGRGMECEGREASARSKCAVSRDCGITSCGDPGQLCQNQHEMQLVSVERLDA